METNSYIEPVYLISAVAEILNIHPQTLRQYEREGLIKPSRTNGKISANGEAGTPGDDYRVLCRSMIVDPRMVS